MNKTAAIFNVYHKWLGIPPKDQPPNYYRLLALDLFEADRDVIANAADQRMMLVRSFQSGENQQYTQQLLNELASARVCLLSPQRKAEYDLQLGAAKTPGGEVGKKVPPRPGRPGPEQASIAPQRASTKLQLASKKPPIASGTSRRLPVIAIAIAIFALLCVGIVLWLSRSSRNTDPIAHTTETTHQVSQPSAPSIAKLPAKPIAVLAPLTMRMVPPQKIKANETLHIKIAADESSSPSERLRFSLAPEAPQGMQVEPASGLLTWTPSKQQAGKSHGIRVTAVDGTRKTQALFEVEVPAEPTEGRKLRIRPIPEQTAAIGAKLQVQPELEPAADSLAPPVVYSLLRGPQGATVNPVSGEFTWQPDAESAGQTFEAKIKVADANGQQAEADITIQVAQAVANPKDPAPQGGKADSRLPVPGLTEQQKAVKNVRLLFADMYDKARTKREDRRILAEKLLSEADNTQDDVVGRYVLYLEGAEQAKNAEDVPLFLKIVDSLATRYAVDATALKQADLIQLSKDITRNEDAAKELTAALFGLVSERIKREEWNEATDILKAAQVSAIKSRDPDLRRQVGLRSREVTALTKAHSEQLQAQETLSRDADNPAANRVAGLYEALVRDNWPGGLPLLAKGDDESLTSAARQELAQPKGADDKKKVADLWATIAKGKSGGIAVKKLLESSPTTRDHALKHAVACYNEALAEASGILKRAIEQQISELRLTEQQQPSGTSRCKSGFSQVVDNNSATFMGTWATWATLGYPNGTGDWKYAAPGSGGSKAIYQFTGLSPGQYRVFATWVPDPNRATNAPFSIVAGGAPVVIFVNQEVMPKADATASGRYFQALTTTTVAGTTLTVTISNLANDNVIADAVRIECR